MIIIGKRSNAVVSQDIAYEYGKTSMQLNGGKIENSGIEFTVAFTPVRKEDWALSISLNSSKNWNKARNQQYEATLNDVLTGSGTKNFEKRLSSFWFLVLFFCRFECRGWTSVI